MDEFKSQVNTQSIMVYRQNPNKAVGDLTPKSWRGLSSIAVGGFLLLRPASSKQEKKADAWIDKGGRSDLGDKCRKRNTLGVDLQISVNRRSSYSFVGVDYRAPYKPQLGLNYTW
ncbi:predicted protein [Histoplasma capsulatum G186AR]|uniref:Uncharacterized protein n=1 Tax=Ajellomyces capsulatus (strain G186AR / H82 / ATCC MYA-2454 / RMSCC 2432) TaxID=447093 RepID=C0NMJ7_AJECG|nr:uncharacterized protein HCBG_03974 [Histoplasma capsulatum G186AR]EEH07095.1 predicted protein [Histoplasma capsulatum G186AR]